MLIQVSQCFVSKLQDERHVQPQAALYQTLQEENKPSAECGRQPLFSHPVVSIVLFLTMVPLVQTPWTLIYP